GTSVVPQQPMFIDLFPAQTNGFSDYRARLGRDQLDDVSSNHFSPPATEHFEHLIVHVHDPSVPADANSFERRRREVAEALLTFAQFRRRPVALTQDHFWYQYHQGRPGQKRLQQENIFHRRILIQRGARKDLWHKEGHQQRH